MILYLKVNITDQNLSHNLHEFVIDVFVDLGHPDQLILWMRKSHQKEKANVENFPKFLVCESVNGICISFLHGKYSGWAQHLLSPAFHYTIMSINCAKWRKFTINFIFPIPVIHSLSEDSREHHAHCHVTLARRQLCADTTQMTSWSSSNIKQRDRHGWWERKREKKWRKSDMINPEHSSLVSVLSYKIAVGSSLSD